jgi:hypothetical protein
MQYCNFKNDFMGQTLNEYANEFSLKNIGKHQDLYQAIVNVRLLFMHLPAHDVILIRQSENLVIFEEIAIVYKLEISRVRRLFKSFVFLQSTKMHSKRQ